jgi:hypothetical protein
VVARVSTGFGLLMLATVCAGEARCKHLIHRECYKFVRLALCLAYKSKTSAT